MTFLLYTTVVLLIIVSVLLILLVLIQKGRGGGLSSAFGGAGGSTAFGSKTGDVLTWSTSIVFNRGHQIRVAISSSNAGRFEPNPNTGEEWPFRMPAVMAHQTIFLGGTEASHIVLPEVPGAGAP